MTDSCETSSIDGVVERLALSSTLFDATDLGELAKMHTDVGELTRLIEDSVDLPGKSEFSDFGAAVVALLEGMVLETLPDIDKIMEDVRRAISEIQSALKADPNVAPLPQDGDFVQHILTVAGEGGFATDAGAPADEAEPSVEEQPEPPADELIPPRETSSSEAAEKEAAEAEKYVAEPLMINDDELDYLKSFITEAYEHLDSVESAVLELEQSIEDEAKINELFRPFHTIKGMAGFLNLRDVNRLTHHAETLLDLARKGDLTLTSDYIDLIFSTVDILKEQIGAIAEYVESPTGEAVPQPNIAKALGELCRATSGDYGKAEKKTGDAVPAESPGIDNKIDAPTEEEGQDELSANQAEPTAVPEEAKSAARKTDLVVRVDTDRLDGLVNMIGELVIAQTLVTQNPSVEGQPRLAKDIAQVAKITREVQEITMSMRMVTLQPTFQKMGRLVRDVSRKSGKLVDYSYSGEDTELDKNVIDEIGDPLMHMVRNAVDHGIAAPKERAAAGKSERGSVHLHAAHQGGSVVIDVTDDGKGLDRDKLIKKGIERSLVSPDDQLSEQEAFALVMSPGFSTAEKITDISGRGVGMDVVKRNIDKLRGKVVIESEKGKGSKFTISLPLTLAIIDGMIVGAGGARFVIPTLTIDQSLRPEKDQVFTVQNRGEMLQIRGELCPLIRLDELFGINTDRAPAWERMVVIVAADGRRAGIILDDLIGQQQVVIKTLGDQFKRVAGISGATILGDGTVGLILNTPGLVAMHNGSLKA